MSLLKKSDHAKIEAAIAAAERTTSGEIVVAIVPRSHDYGWLTMIATVTGVFAGTCIGAARASSLGSLVEWQTAAGLIGLSVGLWPWFRRTATPNRMKSAWVHKESLAYFAGSGVHLTRKRAGVLVFVSELERRIEILADEGIHQRVGTGFWSEQIAEFVASLHRANACEALTATVSRIGAKLAENFPPDPDDQNELSNKIVGPDTKSKL